MQINIPGKSETPIKWGNSGVLLYPCQNIPAEYGNYYSVSVSRKAIRQNRAEIYRKTGFMPSLEVKTKTIRYL